MDERLILEAGRVKDGLRVLVTGGGSGIVASVVDVSIIVVFTPNVAAETRPG